MSLTHLCVGLNPACNQVFRFGGENTYLGGQDFCFYYMFKINLTGNNKTFVGAQKFVVTAPECPRGYELGFNVCEVHECLKY